MSRIELIKKEIEQLHKLSSEEYLREWFYQGHVAIVAKYAGEIAVKSGAKKELSILAALFHDIARCWGIDNEPELMNQSLAKAEEIMKKYAYNDPEIKIAKEAILYHSCKDLRRIQGMGAEKDREGLQ